jgi:hypothetical protein
LSKSRKDPYQITEAGMFTFRKEVVGAIQKREERFYKGIDAQEIAQKYNLILDTLSNTIDLAKKIAKICIENPPLIVQFLKEDHLDFICRKLKARRLALVCR